MSFSTLRHDKFNHVIRWRFFKSVFICVHVWLK